MKIRHCFDLKIDTKALFDTFYYKVMYHQIKPYSPLSWVENMLKIFGVNLTSISVTDHRIWWTKKWTTTTFGSTLFPWQQQNPLSLKTVTHCAIFFVNFGKLDCCDQHARYQWFYTLIAAPGTPGKFCWLLPLAYKITNSVASFNFFTAKGFNKSQ